MNTKRIVASLVLCASLQAFAQEKDGSQFEHLGTYVALGGLMASTVAPGPTTGSERLYASYLYIDNTLDVVAIDPKDGKAEVFHSVVPGEYGARNIAVGPDGNVYLGSLPGAHFLKIDRKAHTMVDLGRPSANEEYIWDVAFGQDQRLYGVTYPGCRLVRYDPATQKMEDLGRMDPTEKYGRWIVGGHDRYMYIGLGTAKANIVVFDTKSGEMREVLPKEFQSVGIAKPYIGVDGKAYATLDDHLFALDGFTVKEIPAAQKVEVADAAVLRNGDVLKLSEGGVALTIKSAHGAPEREMKVSYKGENLQIFRVGFGPDGQLYGSSILPIHFLRFDLKTKQIEHVGDLGGGEIYSFLSHDGKLLMGAYSGLSPLMTYTPGKDFKPAEDGNPQLVNYTGSDHAWRPQAMVQGPDGAVYVGGTAGYGQLEGPLVRWTGAPGSVQTFGNLVKNESVVSLTSTKDLVIGGTTTTGGGGSHPTETDAHVFGWSPATKAKTFDVVPVPGASVITDLSVGKSGAIFGFAISGSKHTLFVLDAHDGHTLAVKDTDFHNVVYNGLGSLQTGQLIGLDESGIFTIDEATTSVKMLAASPVKITGGFELHDGAVYFISNSELYRYWLEKPHAH
jgi:hypothetical protein